MRVEWEQVESSHGDYTYRARVPGGWLVKIISEISREATYRPEPIVENVAAITFYPDPLEAWK